MFRVLFTLLLTTAVFETLLAAGKEIGGERAPASSICPTPEEARAKMSVPEGYEVRCFAHEPMVQNPVAMTWDHRGRLWVVEAYEYPEGSELPALLAVKPRMINTIRCQKPATRSPATASSFSKTPTMTEKLINAPFSSKASISPPPFFAETTASTSDSSRTSSTSAMTMVTTNRTPGVSV